MGRKIRIVCMFLAAALAVRLLLMATMPLFEPSESRYGAIAANMARTGDFLVPRFTYMGSYQSFDGKPPLVFQCGGLLCRAFGVSEFAVRLPVFLSYLALLAIVFFAVRRLEGARAGFLAAGVCATCVALYATAGVCMTDVPLACCSAGALLLYACFRERPSIGLAVGVSLLLGCGMLVKGPVSLVLFGLPVLVDAAVARRWRTLFDVRWLWGLPVFLAVSVPWFWMMQSENPGFLRYFFVNENLLRFLVREYGDRYGAGRETFRGMAVVWALVVTLPWSLVPLWALLRRRRVFRWSGFFATAFCSIVAFWCLTSRVPLAYLLPAVPMFAAWLATSCAEPATLRRLVAPAAAVAALVTAGVLLTGLLAGNKMLGADAPRKISKRHFAYEFYHGPWGEGAPR